MFIEMLPENSAHLKTLHKKGNRRDSENNSINSINPLRYRNELHIIQSFPKPLKPSNYKRQEKRDREHYDREYEDTPSEFLARIQGID
jgi:hypothetical protein